MKWCFAGLIALCLSGLLNPAVAQPSAAGPERSRAGPYEPPSGKGRFLAFISDFHMGLGRQADGSWHPLEDFRWSRALAGFLDQLARRGGDRVDLVIVGDFLELWQAPPQVTCQGRDADLGCTLEEMEQITRAVVTAHREDLGALGAFARRGENRLHIIPGNHDSTLLYQRIWQPVAEALGVESGRVALVQSGIWTSADERIVVEHGHQIGSDANRYAEWPDITRRVDLTDYVIRPWGELFVQRLFNAEEAHYPIIDNLSPETAGLRYRMADRGLWQSAGDVARFLAFNLFETSLSQLSGILGPNGAEADWSIRAGRALGASLFAEALAAEDPFRTQLLSNSDEARAVRAELAAAAANPNLLADAEVRMLCDQIAIRRQKSLCVDPTLGATIEKTLRSRARVMEDHLRARQEQFRPMRTFIYGHTHHYEKPWPVRLNDFITVSVINTGAFQRLVREPHFLNRLAGRSPEEGLRTMTPDDLAPCYTAVFVAQGDDGGSPPELVAWHMPENGAGTVIDP